MAKLFSKKSGDAPSGVEADKKRQQLLVILFLLLLAAVGYAYFFTGLLKPREAVTSAPVQSTQVKQAIPPRPEQGAPKAPLPVPSAEKAPPAAKAEPVKPVPHSVKAEPAKGTVVTPAAKKEVVKASVTPPAARQAKEKETRDIAAAGATKGVKKKAKPGVKGTTGTYTVVIGDYVNDENLYTVKSKLSKLGVSAIMQTNVKRVEPMNRLFVKEFSDHGTAESELQKLRKAVPDAFVLKEQGKYAVYAGSYYSENRARSEMNELNARGVHLSIRKTKATVPMVQLSAGSFATSAAADREVKRLKKQGFATKIAKKS